MKKVPFLLIYILKCWILLSWPVTIRRSYYNYSEREMSRGALLRLTLSCTNLTKILFFSMSLLKASRVSCSRTFNSSFSNSSSACSYSVFSFSRWTRLLDKYFGFEGRRPLPPLRCARWARVPRWIGRAMGRRYCLA